MLFSIELVILFNKRITKDLVINVSFFLTLVDIGTTYHWFIFELSTTGSYWNYLPLVDIGTTYYWFIFELSTTG